MMLPGYSGCLWQGTSPCAAAAVALLSLQVLNLRLFEGQRGDPKRGWVGV